MGNRLNGVIHWGYGDVAFSGGERKDFIPTRLLG